MFLELLAVFLINSIIAFFVFLAAMKMAIMTNPDFGFWLMGKLEDMRDKLEKEQRELEREAQEEDSEVNLEKEK